ncbi:hypothetical protein mRhiFer1_009839 [Rhinolophus ferrumequinum]|uniref:Secreted protein n=1 Tax=Rhinolophus ferrumequinum TaxID=59479 RepID=A0A7J7YS49_RHIFE|nr:hypothetical protein mRhiFer1_009839 [Rhinolophus ferrumequinum]
MTRPSQHLWGVVLVIPSVQSLLSNAFICTEALAEDVGAEGRRIRSNVAELAGPLASKGHAPASMLRPPRLGSGACDPRYHSPEMGGSQPADTRGRAPAPVLFGCPKVDLGAAVTLDTAVHLGLPNSVFMIY